MQAMPFALARRQKESGQIKLLEATGTSFQCFAMRIDSGPFKDVRVRQALRLLADRQAFVDQILNGFGEPGDDLPSRGAKYYADEFKREQDVEQAKSLLKAAGQENLSVRLDTSNVLDGLVDASTLYQQQAKQAGVDVRINRIDPGTYFSVTPGRWLSYPFSATFWVNGTASLGAVLPQCAVARRAVQRDRLEGSRRRQAAVRGDRDGRRSSRRQEKWREVQRLQFDEGGYLVYANQTYVDGLAKNVNGLKPSKAAWVSGFELHNAWLVVGRATDRDDRNPIGAPIVTPERPAAGAAARSAGGGTRCWRSSRGAWRAGVATLLVASLLIFAMTEVLPGDVASVVLGRSATPDAVADLQEELGLDRSFVERYADWLGGLVTGRPRRLDGRLAQGAERRRASASRIAEPMRNSAILAGIAFVLFVPLALTLGVLAGRQRGPADRLRALADRTGASTRCPSSSSRRS